MDGRHAKARLRLTAGMKKRPDLDEWCALAAHDLRSDDPDLPRTTKSVMKFAERKPDTNAVSSDAPNRRIATGAENVQDVQENDAPLPLPHETDQSAESQHEEGTREVGRQAHRDLSRGLTDTDRRGGDAY